MMVANACNDYRDYPHSQMQQPRALRGQLALWQGRALVKIGLTCSGACVAHQRPILRVGLPRGL